MGQNFAWTSMLTILATLLGRLHFCLADQVSSHLWRLQQLSCACRDELHCSDSDWQKSCQAALFSA